MLPQSRRRLWIVSYKMFCFSHKGSAAPKKAGKPAGKGRGKPAKKDESSADEEDDDDDIQEVAVVPKLAAKKVKLVNFKLKPLSLSCLSFKTRCLFCCDSWNLMKQQTVCSNFINHNKINARFLNWYARFCPKNISWNCLGLKFRVKFHNFFDPIINCIEWENLTWLKTNFSELKGPKILNFKSISRTFANKSENSNINTLVTGMAGKDT